jgi:hypothetical protein
LHDVHGVQLGPERPAQLAPHDHPQVGLVSQEGSLGGLEVTFVQPLNQLIQVVDAHVLPASLM